VALTPQVPQDIIDLIRDLQRRISDLETAAPIRNAQISGGQGLTVNSAAGIKVGAGGGVSIGAGGSLTVEDPDGGSSLFSIGALGATFNRPDGTPQPATLLRRDDGTLAFAVYDPVPTVDGYQQYLAVYDRAGNIIAGDDTTSGQGLARPWVAGALYPSRFGELLPTTMAAFEELFAGWLRKQHPYLTVVAWGATDAGTTGELRAVVNGAQLGGTAALPDFSFTAYTFFAPVVGAHLENLRISLEGRRTGGTGNVRVGPLGVWGEQSP